MKKTTLYKTGALCLAFLSVGVFTAFDDAQTDEQKIEAAYNQLVTDFKMEQDQLCKTQALAAAQTQWMEIKNSMSEGGETASSGGNEKPASTSSQGGNSGASSQSTDKTPPPPPKKKEEPKVDPQKARTGAGSTSGDAASQKKRTGAGIKKGDSVEKTAAEQKKRGG